MKTIFSRSGLVVTLLFASLIGTPTVLQADPPNDQYAHNPIHVRPTASSSPIGLSPDTITSVYQFPEPSSNEANQTIAIVDAYDNPNVEADLKVFSDTYGLPECTTDNECFTKVSQHGDAKFPKRKDASWALEISLDVQWAHAIAPLAKILLVEADSASFTDLMEAEDWAAANAQYVSNSWGTREFSNESRYDSHFKKDGVSFFVSSGDNGTPAEYPSSSPNVISVGGTTLNFTDGVFSGETGWSGSGGGCSLHEDADTAQLNFSEYSHGNCLGKRATPDVSLNADPASGVSVYSSFKYRGQKGWWAVGGTSASAPMWAARSAATGTTVDAAYVYGNSITFRDITSGNNGSSCQIGYDLVTGRGSWTH